MNTSPSLGRRIARAGQLAAGERAVADYLTEHPEEAAVSSAAQLGAVTGTSDATVIRTARKLGFDGLGELKRALVEHVARRRDPAKVLGERVKRLPSEGATVLDAVLGAGGNLLEQAHSLIPQQQWAETVRRLSTASRIWVFGIGPSGTVAENFALALRRAGIDADSWTATGFRLADDLLRVRAEHALVVIAPLRVFRETEIVLGHARTAGAYTVLLTEAFEILEPDRADQILRLPESTAGAANELLVPLALLHGLALELAARDSETAVHHHEELNTLRSEITGTPLDGTAQ
ncbi:MurR/RpiR family transcriptional regulator [Sciscionella sediminilitoris]|uniref:MurR/RpiR family transcriptional regulator n=1 Tax=Sciscionella sediminilitoris TaxID=1445613 RepID=UPI0004DF230C|nr:MurR/RpiR family transcriptional regulator [Sciscionella sp. SE31]